ncbi:MAG TPA: hypothetical protein PLR18_02160 [bacterium]|nr:hypothetical protein [bacterium]
MKIVKWSARILALGILIFALPFYFGYGNPLPFAKPDYSLWENVALAMMPLVFIGLALGWKYPKAGGLLTIIPIIIGSIVGLLTEANFNINLAMPIIPGILYLIDGYKKFKIVFSILAILFGAFLIVFGGYDDSPGAQGLGLLLIITTIIIAIRSKNKK